MKEFIEKLIGRLEELRKEYYADYNTYRVEIDLGNVDGLKHAIKIINELAEEYIPCTNPCTDCEAYDLVKHNCPKFCKVIKETVEELAEEYKPKTQADKIRSMSNEELAELFTKLAWNSEVQTTPLKYLDWLQSKVE